MAIILLILSLAQAERVWQLSSDANSVKFSSSSALPMRVGNAGCQDDVLDYTVSAWTWNDRIASDKQFFWALDNS